MQMIAERAAVDIEELLVNGDTSSSDSYLAQLDGIRKQATSHIVDAAGEELTRQTFKRGYKAVPPKYLRIPQEFRFYTSPGIEVEWKDRVADRQTNLGDAAVQGGLSSAFGVRSKVLRTYNLIRLEKEIQPQMFLISSLLIRRILFSDSLVTFGLK